MKHFSLTVFLFLCISLIANASQRYWVGPLNGDWSNSSNWSLAEGGAGGASVPGSADSAIFRSFANDRVRALVHIDQSPNLLALQIIGTIDVVLYASTPVVLTVNKSLSIHWYSTLKDSTSADVPFNVVFNGATQSTGNINGSWVFEGSTPVNRLAGNGASFTAQPGSYVNFLSDPIAQSPAGIAIFRNNTNYITSSPSTLVFSSMSKFILENNLDAAIPSCSWGGPPQNATDISYASSILITGQMGKLIHLNSAPVYRNFSVDLPAQTTDTYLNLPDGATITGNLVISNTNEKTCILLASPTTTSSIDVNALNISVSGKVALARASNEAPGSSFTLHLQQFIQSAGNFSLQDNSAASGPSTLSVSGSIVETGGTFKTNSNSTIPGASFTLEINGPLRSDIHPETIVYQSSMLLSSGSIDNDSHNVVLKMAQKQYLSYWAPVSGLDLKTPVSVGRLVLVTGTVNTSSINVLTVNNPGSKAGVVVLNQDSSYVNGPIRRFTNSTDSYLFPTGKGRISDFKHYDSCVVIPASTASSLYQAEYYNGGYPDARVTTPLTGVANNKFWNIIKLGGADASVKLFLNGTAVPGAVAADALVVAAYGGTWSTANGTTLTPGNATSGSVTSKPLTAPGLFTFGYGNPVALNPGNGVFNGLNYKYYEGGYNIMPDFSMLSPVKTGNSATPDLSIRRSGVNDSFAIVWEGYINIPAAGSYTFETISDDGSQLYFNSLYNSAATPLVNNDGVHAPQSATGTVNVPAAGRYPVTITYFENNGGEKLEVYWTGPGFSRQQIPASAFTDGTAPPTSSGLNYKYYEGSFDVLPDFSTLTPIKTGNTPNVDISVRTAGVNDYFAFTWDGTITIPTSGTYTFETVSDDGSKLYVNGNIISSNDGLHAPTSATGTVTLSAGVYPIFISYFEKDGGETMQVYWSGPGISRQAIPDAAFSSGTITPPSGKGLNYKYYEGDFNMLPDFNFLTPVKTGTSPNADISVRPEGVNDHFAFVWEGTIILPTAGSYTFETISDDGSSINFNGINIVNNDGLHAPTSKTGTIAVNQAGTYPIRISFFEKDGGETMQLYWSGPGIARQLIPDAAFGSITTPPVSNRGLNYKYYEGDFNVLPDYSSLTPVKTGTTNNVDISIRRPGVNDHFAFIWDGYINLPSAGSYTFETISDDGSKVYFNQPYSVNGNSTVNNDGLHAPNSANGTVTVPSAGRYPISITFFEKDGGETMQLYWSGPGITRQLIPDTAFTITSTTSGTAILSGSDADNINSISGGPVATRIYPNPFTEDFTIDYYNAGSNKNNISIGLFDLNGKLIYKYQPAIIVPGYNSWRISLGSRKLAVGTYIAQLKVNGIPVKTLKLLKTVR